MQPFSFVPLINKYKTLGLLITLWLCSFLVFSQDRCGSVQYHSKRILKNPLIENKSQFENWIQQRSLQSEKKSRTGRTQATYRIPVVVHIIHNGETHATNISDEQVLSQIRVLNEDFNRENADATQTPADFLGVAGSLDIEFVLAKETPEGLPTNGIVRVQGTKSSWTINDNYELKSMSYWPAEDYLNLWVCNITDYIGYAQFPESDILSGLEGASTNRLTDGVVITYDAFGSIDDGSFDLQSKYNKGRTATHEIAHFFGLRHIWGDDDGACLNESGHEDDYVNDTPDQGDKNTGCPSHPKSSCGATSMFQNFLDYTNDACMNLFTQGQVDRMTIVIENSPRRKSLLTSHGLTEPDPVADDLGIKEILSPVAGSCDNSVVPKLWVRNYGNNHISSASIRVSKNNTEVETKNFTVDLDPLDSTILSFSPVPVSSGTSTFHFLITQVNDNADVSPINNTATQNVLVPAVIDAPFTEEFNSVPPDWDILNPDHVYTWELTAAPYATTDNYAMKMDFYNYEDNLGEVDLLVTPMFDLLEVDGAFVQFDVAYARYQGSNDGLRVVVLDNCNTDITTGSVVYDKSGAALRTTDDTSNAFVPKDTSSWRTETIDLSPYAGQTNLQLAFVGINDYGNNVYIDNIMVLNESKETGFNVYPNPLTNSDPELMIRFNLPERETIILEVVDQMGRTVLTQTWYNTFNQTNRLIISHLNPGMYIARVATSSKTYATKFIKLE